MADIIPSTVVETVLEILTSNALQEIGVAWGLEDELERLESRLSAVQSVLRDAEQKQRKNESLRDWLRKLKLAADDAEIILEEIKIEGFKRRRGPSNWSSLLWRWLSCNTISHKVKAVRERLDDIAEERHKFHPTETEGVSDNSVGGILESRETISLVNEQEIVGRKEEKEMIIKTLLETTLDDELSVYAIWGMGGLGKTTLAQLVYNDERTESHFDLRIWVCVSDDFSIKRILRAIIVSIDEGGCNISELGPLQHLVLDLQKKLRGKRFLLVLDDVWNEKDRDVLKVVLRCGSRGSVLLVTTQIEKVARMMAAIHICRPKYLTEADSWTLFSQRAFAAGEVEESLTEIGRAIVKKCGGLPLAVKSLGSLMRTKSSEREWLAIEKSGIWLLPEHENGILPALRLSYDNLPPHLRQCFAYCCIFPRGYLMNEDQLIELWMAIGFLTSEGERDLYLKGHQIFKELVCRAFFQDVSGKTCKMHNLVHDLAKSIMKDENYVVEHGAALNIPKMPRHLCFDVRYKRFPKLKLPLIASKSLHLLIVHGDSLTYGEDDLPSFLSEQQSLRVLHLPRMSRLLSTSFIPRLSNSICKLEHLKYLAMSCFKQKMLPESLTSLHCLQTLKLSESDNLLELPKGLKHMTKLWFLDIESHRSLVCTPDGVGELTCLQRLSIFIVGQNPATQIDQLKELNLGGELSIQGLGNVRNLEDAENANLMGKKNLTSLTLSWKKSSKENSPENFEEVLKRLQPYHNLQKLFIMSYQGSRFPDWMSTSAWKDLTEISLEGCHRCERLPTLGKLPSLTRLNLCNMDSIKDLDAEWHGNGETSFPALTYLTIEGMPNFEEWTIPDSGESFPFLACLKIKRCKRLNGLPPLPALRDLAIWVGNVSFLTEMERCCSRGLIGRLFLETLPEGFLQHQQNLESLKINGLCNMRTLSDVLDNKSALRTLELDSCPNLESLPTGLEHLNSLEGLYLSNCDSLTSFPATILQDLSSLRTLYIHDCKRLNPLSGELQRESTLEILWIRGCPEFKNFPESMQQLTSLIRLTVGNCEELRSLPNWLGHLQSLRVMFIDGSKYLNSLPDGFQTPESLQSLCLYGCDPQLEKRCKKPEGEDWPKISHIPQIIIDGKIIQWPDGTPIFCHY